MDERRRHLDLEHETVLRQGGRTVRLVKRMSARRGDPTTRCKNPKCKDPFGGYVRPNRDRPDRRRGFCQVCGKRDDILRGRQVKPPGCTVERCIDPECDNPWRGRPAQKGERPERIHGRCRKCHNRQRKRFDLWLKKFQRGRDGRRTTENAPTDVGAAEHEAGASG